MIYLRLDGGKRNAVQLGWRRSASFGGFRFGSVVPASVFGVYRYALFFLDAFLFKYLLRARSRASTAIDLFKGPFSCFLTFARDSRDGSGCSFGRGFLRSFGRRFDCS